ncbi:MAG: DUF6883 domain-containing protein [Bacteroidota bacterium]
MTEGPDTLPNAAHAWIPEGKLNRYLLNPHHRRGKHKARFFARHGYKLANTETLEKELLNHAASGTVVGVRQTAHGINYAVEGVILSIHFGFLPLRTIWAFISPDPRPRFVTA